MTITIPMRPIPAPGAAADADSSTSWGDLPERLEDQMQSLDQMLPALALPLPLPLQLPALLKGHLLASASDPEAGSARVSQTPPELHTPDAARASKTRQLATGLPLPAIGHEVKAPSHQRPNLDAVPSIKAPQRAAQGLPKASAQPKSVLHAPAVAVTSGDGAAATATVAPGVPPATVEPVQRQPAEAVGRTGTTSTEDAPQRPPELALRAVPLMPAQAQPLAPPSIAHPAAPKGHMPNRLTPAPMPTAPMAPAASDGVYLQVPFDNGKVAGELTISKAALGTPFTLLIDTQPRVAEHLRQHWPMVDQPWTLRDGEQGGQGGRHGQGDNPQQEQRQPWHDTEVPA